jgi:hypothetical protein
MIALLYVRPSRPACRALVSGVSCAGAQRVAALLAAESSLALPELVVA